MSQKEFVRWQIYYRINPFGDIRADIRAGQVASPLLNVLLKANFKDPKLSKVSDWIVDFFASDKPPEQQDWREMKAVLKAFADNYKKPNPKPKPKESNNGR